MDMITDRSTDPKRVRINFWVPSNIYQWLEYASKRDGHSMSEIIRASLKQYMLQDVGIQTQLDEKQKEYQGQV